ncbi:MATE family efflux transporter [Thermohalobacter berrensis]|uniref:MATE family efflux transporter n=1 Tax=Thermohalobacter berrensis TaxID=99594 RepID=UPI000E75F36D|nr:MATE family efflux transporter [Thermohalobacter berrensis]
MLNEVISKKRIHLIWKLAWPVMLSQILQTLFEIADMYFISNIGIIEAVAATGISTSIIGVLIVFSQLIATGTIALISRKTGENDIDGVLNISKQALILAFIIGLILSVLIYIYSQNIINIFKVDKNVEKYALIYLKIVLLSIPFIFLNLTGRAVLQAQGDAKTPMIIFALMNILNIILDPALIYGFLIIPKIGYSGAAIATATSNIIASFFMLYVINKKVFNIGLTNIIRNLQINIHIMFRILKIGFYSAIQAISRPITGLVMYKIANYAGTNAVAAFTIGVKMFNLVFIFLTGLNMSISVLTGQNLGKKDLNTVEEVVKDGLKLALANMIVFLIPYFLFAKQLMMFFTSDISVINIGVNYLRITYVGIVFVIFPIVYGGAFVGAGDTAPPMVASLVANWIFKIPFAYIFSEILGIGANGVWLAISLSVIFEAIIVTVWFKKGKWKCKEV